MNGLEIFPEILSKESCEKIIELFANDTRKVRGRTSSGRGKLSTDLCCQFDTKRWSEYSNLIVPGLNNLAHNVKQKYPFLVDGCHFWKVEDHYNIQHYKDGEGYYDLHNEHNHIHCHRMMAWMIYLNDAECGTEFPYQDTVVKAEQGKGVIWSAEWTHPHKGVTPNIGDKYIVSGWFVYYEPRKGFA